MAKLEIAAKNEFEYGGEESRESFGKIDARDHSINAYLKELK